MHMADALLSPAVGGAMWAAATAVGAYSARRVREAADDRKPVSWDLYYTVYRHLEEVSSPPPVLLRKARRIPEGDLESVGVPDGRELSRGPEEESSLFQPPAH